MEYENFIQEISSLDFIEDRETAEAGIKTVLRILTSRMEDPDARQLTEKLPPALSFDNLHQKHGPAILISLDEAITRVAAQFKLEHTQAVGLIGAVLDGIKRTIGTEETEKLERHLPPDWVSILRQGSDAGRQYMTP